ncbi:hypothetical protein NDU88_005701 [Pleurodeles waltl]|uniref:Uncharacterized protein n=1 Tax=Pleurodeles waltl TaxID=8319 RepID=A0AAV7WVF8_PLEWA|nr:hypothetical protein NDU88_005701 [Pleurodeles waltl]
MGAWPGPWGVRESIHGTPNWVGLYSGGGQKVGRWQWVPDEEVVVTDRVGRVVDGPDQTGQVGDINGFLAMAQTQGKLRLNDPALKSEHVPGSGMEKYQTVGFGGRLTATSSHCTELHDGLYGEQFGDGDVGDGELPGTSAGVHDDQDDGMDELLDTRMRIWRSVSCVRLLKMKQHGSWCPLICIMSVWGMLMVQKLVFYRP